MIREKDDFYQKMFRLSIPIIIQGLLSAAVNSADVIMLNYVGQSSISAVSLAANYQISFLWCITDWVQVQHCYVPSILEEII